MQFFYHEKAGDDIIYLDTANYHYLFRVRRFRGKELFVRNLRDLYLYVYHHDKNNIFLLDSATKSDIAIPYYLKLAMAIIDIKDIYALLPALNALGVESLSLFYAEFSQRNRSLCMDKMHSILRFSCMQCNRILPMQVEIIESMQDVLVSYANISYIDFAKDNAINIESLDRDSLKKVAMQAIMIGPEGGFSKKERELVLCNQKCYSLTTKHILTTHLSATYIASLYACSL